LFKYMNPRSSVRARPGWGRGCLFSPDVRLPPPLGREERRPFLPTSPSKDASQVRNWSTLEIGPGEGSAEGSGQGICSFTRLTVEELIFVFGGFGEVGLDAPQQMKVRFGGGAHSIPWNQVFCRPDEPPPDLCSRPLGRPALGPNNRSGWALSAGACRKTRGFSPLGGVGENEDPFLGAPLFLEKSTPKFNRGVSQIVQDDFFLSYERRFNRVGQTRNAQRPLGLHCAAPIRVELGAW